MLTDSCFLISCSVQCRQAFVSEHTAIPLGAVFIISPWRLCMCTCVFVCVCVPCFKFNEKNLLLKSKSGYLYTHTHIHTSYSCYYVYAHWDAIYTKVMVALKWPHMYSHLFVDVLIWAHRVSLLKHLCTRAVPRIPVVHPSKSFWLSSACENIHCSQPMRWLFQDPDRAVWKDQVNSACSFVPILDFNSPTQLLNQTCLCFRSLGHPLLIPTEKSMVMRSAFQSPTSPITVETHLTLTLQWRISSHVQTTASLFWPVPLAVGT